MDAILLQTPISPLAAVQSVTCPLNLNAFWLTPPPFAFPPPRELPLRSGNEPPVNQSSQAMRPAAFLHATVRLEVRWILDGVCVCGGGAVVFFLLLLNYTSSSFLFLPALGDRSSLKCCPWCFHTLNFPRCGRALVAPRRCWQTDGLMGSHTVEVEHRQKEALKCIIFNDNAMVKTLRVIYY